MGLYKEGCERIEENLDIIQMMKAIVHNTEAVKATVMNIKLQENIIKSDKLVISMDEHCELADDTKFEMQTPKALQEKEALEGQLRARAQPGETTEMTNLQMSKAAHAQQI